MEDKVDKITKNILETKYIDPKTLPTWLPHNVANHLAKRIICYNEVEHNTLSDFLENIERTIFRNKLVTLINSLEDCKYKDAWWGLDKYG